MQTESGGVLDLLDPRPEQIRLEEIAVALSKQCRFNGHVPAGFYSVATHCVNVATLLEHNRELARWGLMHDAGEAYIGDVISPLKALVPGLKLIEERLLIVIADRFKLSWPMPGRVKEADLQVLAAEKRDLLAECERPWRRLPEPWSQRVTEEPHWMARERFLYEAARLAIY